MQLWQELLEYARWTPSPHNIQPWKLHVVSETKAELYYDPERLIPTLDPTSAFTVTGMAMFIEALCIAASPYHYTLAVEYKTKTLDADVEQLQFFAILTLKKTIKKETLDRNLLLQRKTSRLQYNGQPVAESVLASLQQVAKTYHHTATFTSDPATVAWAIDLNKETMFYDLDDNAGREELSKWIRSSMHSAKEKKDGLAAYCMGFSAPLTYTFFHWHSLFKIKFVRRIVGNYYVRNSMEGTKTVGWLSGPFFTFEDWINTGRMFLRFWLTMTAQGVYLHPFGSVITNKKSHAILVDRLQQSEVNTTVWLLFRLGQSDEPPRSMRLSAEEISVPI